MGALQPWHLIVVLVVVLLVFGPGKLPGLGKWLGDGLRELKKATSGEPAPGTPATAEARAGAAPAPAVPPGAGVPVCASCGAGAPAGARFCGRCGVSLSATSTGGPGPARA